MRNLFTPGLFRDMGGLLVAAVLLGGTYNSSSPLGVRSPVALPVTGTGTAVYSVGSPVSKPTPQAAVPPDAVDPALHNETITAVVVASAAAPGGNQPSQPLKLPVSMTWAEVKPLLAKGENLLVDARDSASYEAGHIPGAESLPLKLFNERIELFLSRHPKNKAVVIYCASLQCQLSHAEAVLLADQFGYQDVRVMPGGFAEWRVAEPTAVASTGTTP